MHVLRNLFAVRLDAHHAVLGKGVARVAQQSHRVKEIVDDHRLEDVELKVALRPREGNRRVVANHLHAHHRHRLTLGGVHLAGHDRRAGFVLWQDQFVQPAPWTRSQPANVVSDLHQRAGQGLQRSAGHHQGIVRGKCLKFVGCRHKGQVRHCRNLGRHTLAKFRMGVEPRPHSRAADGQFIDMGKRHTQAFKVVLQLRDIA